MDYEKKYKDALERARELQHDNRWVTTIFPELRKSEDEKIRKEIIEYFKHYSGGDNVSIKFPEWIAWLEKQGEKELDPRYSILDKLIEADDIYQMSVNDTMVGEAKNKAIEALSNLEISKLLGLEKQGEEESVLKSFKDEDVRKFMQYIEKQAKAYELNLPNRSYDIYAFAKDILSWLEKQGEQKPTNKVEPKFRAGDWIIDIQDGEILHINKVLEHAYGVTNLKGGSYEVSRCSIETWNRLWTIKDAKNGDVLVYGDNPNDHHVEITMLFKSMRTSITAFTHFHIYRDVFGINSWCDCGKTAHPATKEQRDLLFQKMKESGYEWDAVKKELSKIKQEPTEWSEGDEENLNQLHKLIVKTAYKEYEIDTEDETLYGKWLKLDNWLKSLKERIKGE